MKKYRMAKIIFRLFGKYAIMKYIDQRPKKGSMEYLEYQKTGYF